MADEVYGVVDIKDCSSCDEDHPKLPVYELKEPANVLSEDREAHSFKFKTICPVTKFVIYLREVD